MPRSPVPREPGHIAAVLKEIQPAVAETKGQPGRSRGEHRARDRRAPVGQAVAAQRADPQGSRGERQKLEILAARYDLESGKVSMLPLTKN